MWLPVALLHLMYLIFWMYTILPMLLLLLLLMPPLLLLLMPPMK